MTTLELLEKGAVYYFNNDLNKQFLPSYEAMASSSLREQLVFKTKLEEVVNCNAQIGIIAEQINRRKDLKKVLSKKPFIGFKGQEFLEEHSIK